MSYATTDQLAVRSLPPGALADLTTPQLQAALDDASSIIDDYIGGRFGLPLTGAIPNSLVRAACDIAAYFAMKLRGFNPETGDAEQFLAAYNAQLKYLKDVQAGKATPGGLTALVPDSSDPQEVVSAPFVVSPAAGNAACQDTPAFPSKPPSTSYDSDPSVGTPGTPILRGW